MTLPSAGALLDPTKAGRILNRVFHSRGFRREFNPTGVDVVEADWDNLVVLDACRYDVYADRVGEDLGGELGSRQSQAGLTSGFVQATFGGRALHDVVYVSDNMWFERLREEIDAEVHRFVDLEYMDDGVDWAVEEVGIVTPETVTEYARDASASYPNKRLIVHYLQPHHPFLGEIGRRHFDYPSTSLPEVVERADDEVVREHLRDAYVENLDIVLEEVRSLLPDLRGKTVITADHGEMLGDRHDYVPVRDYGHHRHVWNDATVEVPWHVFESGARREITAEPPDPASTDADPETVQRRLEALGYAV